MLLKLEQFTPHVNTHVTVHFLSEYHGFRLFAMQFFQENDI